MFLQVELIEPLSFKVGRRKRMFEIRILRGVPLVIIHAVRDAENRTFALAQQAIEAATEFLSGDFARITRADRRDDIRPGEACLHTIHLTIELHAVGREILPRQVRQRVLVAGKNSLVGEVMNRHANPTRTPLPCPPLLLVQEEGREAGLPIMQMHHVRLCRQVQRQVRDCLGKEDEPLGIVAVISTVLLIQT